MSCGDYPQDCITDHWCPVIEGRACGKRQWSAVCPACGLRKLSISLGERARIVYTCHHGCSTETVRGALERAGVPAQCLPGTRAGLPPKVTRSAEEKRVIDFVVTNAGLPGPALGLGVLLELGIPAAEARKMLGLTKTTYYRAVTQIPTRK